MSIHSNDVAPSGLRDGHIQSRWNRPLFISQEAYIGKLGSYLENQLS